MHTSAETVYYITYYRGKWVELKVYSTGIARGLVCVGLYVGQCHSFGIFNVHTGWNSREKKNSTEFVESWAFRVRFLFNFSAFVVKSIVRKSEREDLLLNDYNWKLSWKSQVANASKLDIVEIAEDSRPVISQSKFPCTYLYSNNNLF